MKSREEIRAYLKGELSDKDRFEFEKEMLSDPFLNDAVEGFQTQSIEELDQLVRSTDQQIVQRSTQTRKVPYIRWAAAASIMVMAGVGLFYLLKDPIKEETTAVNLERDSFSDTVAVQIEDPLAESFEARDLEDVAKQTGARLTIQDVDAEEFTFEDAEEFIAEDDETQINSVVELDSKELAEVANIEELVVSLDVGINEEDESLDMTAPATRSALESKPQAVSRSKKISEDIVLSGTISSSNGPLEGANIYRDEGPLVVTSPTGEYNWRFGFKDVVVHKNGYQDRSLSAGSVILRKSDPKMEYNVLVRGNELSRAPTPMGGRVLYLENLKRQLNYPEEARSGGLDG